MLKLPFSLPRFTLRLRLSLSITAIVVLFTLTNITYQISSQNRNQRLDNLQQAVQGQLASVTIRQALQNQQNEILILDALKQSDEEKLSDDEIKNGIDSLSNIAAKIIELESYTYIDAVQAYQQLTTSHAELDMLWNQFYTGYNADQAPLISSIENTFEKTIELLASFEAIEISAAEKQTDSLQKASRLTDQITLGIYLFTIVLTVGLGYLLIRYTIRSLKDLNHGTVRIGGGDLDYHIPINSDDEIGDLTIAFNDMADKLRNAMAQVRQSKENADQANKAKTHFLANMSHELRTPLNAIIGYSEMIIEVYGEEQQLDEEQVAEDLQHILSSGRHLLQLINDVLDLAKIESGNMTIFSETFDSVDIIRDLITTMTPLAKKGNNTLQVETSSDIPKIHSDAVKFRQIFINLLSNACKFTENGKITILVTHNPVSRQLIYHVNDTGIGMSAEQMQRIFEAFVQADSSTAQKYGGTGLGLAICKQFVELMHGTLDVTSAEGQGSTFTIVLPVQTKNLRKPAIIPTKNQQELGLTPPTANAESTEIGEPLTQSAIPRETDILLLHSRHGIDDLLLEAANSKDYNTLQLRASAIHADFRFDEYQDTDLLAGCLSNDKIDFGEKWQIINELLPALNDRQLPALFIFVGRDTASQIRTVLDHYDFTNRKRLTIPVRQYNPNNRRGNALLIGYSGNDSEPTSNPGSRTRLETELLAEAWHCTNIDSGEQAVKQLQQRLPNLIFLNNHCSEDDMLTLLSSLQAIAQQPGNEQQSSSLPGIFIVNDKAETTYRILDQAAVEIIIPVSTSTLLPSGHF